MRTLNDALGLEQPNMTGAPAGEMVPMDIYGPSDVEEIFKDPREGLPQPKPMQVRTADASGNVPVPMRAPEMSQNRDGSEESPPLPERGERSEQMFKGPLVSPNDSRYSDVNNLIVGDVITGGALPWIQAVADLASGRIPIEQFDAARQEHERRIEEIKAGHSNVVQAAEKALPLLSGLGIGMLKPAKTIAGTVGRGMAVGGAEGFVQGATSGPIEEPTLSGERVGRGVGGAAEGAALSGFGAALPGGTKEAKDMLGRRAERIAREDEAAARAAARRASAAKSKQTRETRLRQKQMEEANKIKDDRLVERFESYRTVPGRPVKDWKEKRSLLNEHPEIIFKAQAKMNPDVADFAKQVNLPPVAILNKLRGAKINVETPQEKILQQQLLEIDESWQAVRRRGASTPSTSEKVTVAQKGAAPKSQWTEPPAGKATPKAEPKQPHSFTNDGSLVFDERVKSRAYEIDPLNKPMRMDQFTEKWNSYDDFSATKPRVRAWLEDAGFVIEKIKGVTYVRSPDAPSASAKPSGSPAAAAAKPAGSKPARTSGGSKSRSTKPTTPARKPGDEPIRVPSKPNRADRDY